MQSVVNKLCLLLVLSAPLFALGSAVDHDRLLGALAKKETGLGWDGTPGPRGELSAWQITAAVWAQHSREPFATAARDAGKARAVALQHLRWLAGRIERAGHAATPERLATCWHYGHTHRRRESRWGREVENLYHVEPGAPLIAATTRTRPGPPAAKPREARPPLFTVPGLQP